VAEELPLARPHLEHAEVLAVLRSGLVPGLAARDAERLAATVPEHEADRLHRRALEAGDHPAVRRTGLAREASALVRAGHRHGAARGDEPGLCLLAEAGVAQEPAVVLEEADDGRARSQRAHVVHEPGAGIAGRARARDDGSHAENDGAQADDNGFQNVPPQWGTGHGARRSRAPQASARRCRSCL